MIKVIYDMELCLGICKKEKNKQTCIHCVGKNHKECVLQIESRDLTGTGFHLGESRALCKPQIVDEGSWQLWLGEIPL
jgi:hypothetical protein